MAAKRQEVTKAVASGWLRVIAASAILRHRWIAKGLYSRCAVVRRRIFQCSYGLQRDRAWSKLRRMSLWTNPENVQNLSSSAARSLPRCYSLRILTRFEFGYGTCNREFVQKFRLSQMWFPSLVCFVPSAIPYFLKEISAGGSQGHFGGWIF